MTRALPRYVAILALLSVTACGNEGYIVLEVHSDLSIPNEVNGLEVQVISPGGGQELLLQTVALVVGQSFPLDVVIAPSERTPETVEERVTATLDGTPVARVRTVHDWDRGKVTRAVLPPLEAVP